MKRQHDIRDYFEPLAKRAKRIEGENTLQQLFWDEIWPILQKNARERFTFYGNRCDRLDGNSFSPPHTAFKNAIIFQLKNVHLVMAVEAQDLIRNEDIRKEFRQWIQLFCINKASYQMLMEQTNRHFLLSPVGPKR